MSDVQVFQPERLLSTHAIADLLAAIRHSLSLGRTCILVDLSHVSFMDSRGLAGLIMAYKSVQKAGGEFSLSGLQGQPKMLLEITEAHQVFSIYASMADAKRTLLSQAEQVLEGDFSHPAAPHLRLSSTAPSSGDQPSRDPSKHDPSSRDPFSIVGNFFSTEISPDILRSPRQISPPASISTLSKTVSKTASKPSVNLFVSAMPSEPETLAASVDSMRATFNTIRWAIRELAILRQGVAGNCAIPIDAPLELNHPTPTPARPFWCKYLDKRWSAQDVTHNAASEPTLAMAAEPAQMLPFWRKYLLAPAARSSLQARRNLSLRELDGLRNHTTKVEATLQRRTIVKL
jgi:anti-anti-sigma factor